MRVCVAGRPTQNRGRYFIYFFVTLRSNASTRQQPVEATRSEFSVSFVLSSSCFLICVCERVLEYLVRYFDQHHQTSCQS